MENMNNILKNKELYPFQSAAIERLDKYYSDNKSGKGYLHIATGGGKTLVANYYLAKYYLPKGKRVLWLAWDWELLEQARSVLEKEFFSEKYKAVYIADTKSAQNKNIRKKLLEFDEAEQNDIDFQIMYSSMQTFRSYSSLGKFNPDLLIIDEAHHGKNGETEKNIFEFINKNRIPVLGLSGTPKKRKGWTTIDSISFKALVDSGHLAKPILHSVSTDIKIDATRTNARDAFNLIQDKVYKELSGSMQRNEKIIQTYDRKQHGKTIVFAIDIPHAETLSKMFYDKGVSAYPIHSARGDSSEAIEYFKKNKYEVAVAVNKLNQGIDIPDVQTLFITRPVTSDIMYSQMIGRGARLCKEKGKATFLVVDFEDNFIDEELQRMIFEPKREYFGSREAAKSIYSSSKKLKSFKDKPENIFPYTLQIYNKGIWDYYHLALEHDSVNLPVLLGQTFGIEIEMTTDDADEILNDEKSWNEIAEQIYQCMKDGLPQNLLGVIGPHGDKYHNKDYSKFNLVYDGSCGWEIVSPVLKGIEGFEVLNRFLQFFSNQIRKVKPAIDLNFETGLHVHFGFSLDNINLPLFLCNLYDIETHVACLLPPSRFNKYDGLNFEIDEPNPYCVPLCLNFEYEELLKVKNKKKLKEILIDDDGELDRYMSVNFKNLLERDGIGTIEIRLHSGTFNPKKVLSWISLWMGILEAAQELEFESIIEDTEDINPRPEDFKKFEKNLFNILPRHKEMISKVLVPRSREIEKIWNKYIYSSE